MGRDVSLVIQKEEDEDTKNGLKKSIAMLAECIGLLEAAEPTTAGEAETKGLGKQLWSFLHPKVVSAAQSRYLAGHYADAVEAALKELNQAVKEAVRTRTGEEADGAALMNKAFSPNNPIIKLADLTSQSGQDEQKGYMMIFSGTMTGVRNPKAHANVSIDAQRAIHLLFLASLLMWRLEEVGVLKHTGAAYLSQT